MILARRGLREAAGQEGEGGREEGGDLRWLARFTIRTKRNLEHSQDQRILFDKPVMIKLTARIKDVPLLKGLNPAQTRVIIGVAKA